MNYQLIIIDHNNLNLSNCYNPASKHLLCYYFSYMTNHFHI